MAPDGIKDFFDKTFGTPQEALKTVKEISGALTALDERKLRLVKSVLESVGKIKGSPEELQGVLDLVKIIVSHPEQVKDVKDITANLVKLVKLLPKEALKQLPLKEIVGELRKG